MTDVLFLSRFGKCAAETQLLVGLGLLLLAAPAPAQSLTGIWQGVETETSQPGAYWPAVLRLQKSKGGAVLGVLYEEVGANPGISVTFQMQGRHTGTSLRLEHGDKLNETGRTLTSYWCDGSITFTYDPALEKLTGHATYRPVGDCSVGTFTLLPHQAEIGRHGAGRRRNQPCACRAATCSGLPMPPCKQPLAAGNTYRTRLSKTTTFYLTQSYYPTEESPVVPITIQVSGQSRPRPRPRPPRPTGPTPATAAARCRAPARRRPSYRPAPVVLPTVLFKAGHARAAARSRSRPSTSWPPSCKARPAPAPARGGPHRQDRRARQKPGALRAARRSRERLPGAGRHCPRAPQHHWLRRYAPALPLARCPQPARGSGRSSNEPRLF